MKLKHLRNNQVVNDAAKQPSADSLEYGEIAINYKKDKELLFIKNDQDEIVSFLTKDAVIELISTLETNLNSEISYLKNLSLPYVLVSGTGYLNIDGNTIAFNNANKQLIYITGPICFDIGDSHASNGACNYIRIPHLDSRTQGDSMRSMFGGCSSITSLYLSGFETSLVTDMSYMFSSCQDLTSLDLSSFDTSSVTNMSYMFNYCPSLTSLDLSNFDTSSVTNMSYMFNYCSGLTSLGLSSFDTSSVTNMDSMFSNCSGLTSLDLSNFDTSSVTNMGSMFYKCSGLTSLLLGPNFFKVKSSKVTSIDFSYLTKWTNDTVVASLVTNSYDRATARLKKMTLKLSANTKAALTDEQKAAITAKGYTIA